MENLNCHAEIQIVQKLIRWPCLYQTLSNCMGITSVGHDLFPEIDKQMTQYLTPHILSAEHLEMSQCLFFIASQVQLDIDNTDEVN